MKILLLCSDNILKAQQLLNIRSYLVEPQKIISYIPETSLLKRHREGDKKNYTQKQGLSLLFRVVTIPTKCLWKCKPWCYLCDYVIHAPINWWLKVSVKISLTHSPKSSGSIPNKSAWVKATFYIPDPFFYDQSNTVRGINSLLLLW